MLESRIESARAQDDEQRRAAKFADARFAALVVLAYVPVAIFAITHHEMWRDELHCWLVARDSATPWDVVRNRAYDGQPPLWYLLLWVLEKTTHAPLSMQIVHVLIATSVVWVFARFAPFGRSVRALFPFGYFLAYEYVAISRCYGLAMLFALLLCVRHSKRFERPLATSLLLAALALTTTVATLVVVAYGVTLAVDWVEAHFFGGDRAARRAWVPLATAMAACLAAGLCAWPPADSTVTQVRLPTAWPDDFAPTRLIAGVLPIPRMDFFFWNSNALLWFEPLRRVALPAALALGSWLAFVLSRERTSAVLFIVGSCLLMALFGGVYGGDVRHHGFFFVLFLMGAWLVSAAESTRERTAPPARPWSRLRRSALSPTLLVVLSAHVAGAAIALSYDYKYIFSSGTRAAAALRARGLEDSLFVAEIDFPATAVLGQLGRHAFAYSPRTGRPFSFVKWTSDRHWDPSDRQTLDFAAALGASRGRDPILLMNRPLVPALVDGTHVTKLAELYDSMIEEENFYIYRVSRGQTPQARSIVERAAR